MSRMLIGFTLALLSCLLLELLPGCCVGVIDAHGGVHHAGIGVDTNPVVVVRVGWWYSIPAPPPHHHHYCR